MKKIDCAVIGMGVGARHAAFYENYKYTNLTKIFEINKDKWKSIKKKFPKVKLVKNEDEIFQDPKIKLISLASYDNYHFKQIIKATKSKKNIFVEKPICLFLDQLKEIKKEVKKSKVYLSCNFVLRENLQFKKIEKIAQEIYHASEVVADTKVRQQLKDFEEKGFGKLPVCIAKTQYSFSTDPSLKGAPTGHVLPVREVRLSSGAEFIVVVCGEIMTMPGLPRVPAADSIKLNKDGEIEGLF